MTNKTKHISIAILVLLTLAATVLLVACQPQEPVDPNLPAKQVTVTVDFGIEGAQSATFQAEAGKSFYFDLQDIPKPISPYTFVAYYFGGEPVTVQTLAPDSDFTVTAHWLADYEVEIWLENEQGEFVKDNARTRILQSALGSDVTVQPEQIEGYVYDETAKNVTSATVNGTGVTLKLYYKLAVCTVSFSKGAATAATGEMQSLNCKYGQSVLLPECGYVSQTAEFVGYNDALNNSGTSYAVGQEITLTSDVTLYAVWRVGVTQRTWVESDSADGQYVAHEDGSFSAIVGSTVESVNPDDSKYVLDSAHDGSVNAGVVEEYGLILSSYYALRTFTLTYSEDGFTQQAKWGQSVEVRTPQNDNPTEKIISYCTSQTGNGRDCEFGSSITLKSDVTLYPVIMDVYQDADGSGDVINLRRNFTGLGAATLVKNGKEYDGFLTLSYVDNYLIGADMDFNVDGTVYYARIDAESMEKNLFQYRDEDLVGTYIEYEYLYDAFGTRILAFDGYKTGTLGEVDASSPDGRVAYYVITKYELTELGDYYVSYFHPSQPDKVVRTYFKVVKETSAVDSDVDGYFMEFGVEGNAPWQLVRNGDFQDEVLDLDGYGNGILYEIGATDSGENELIELARGNYFLDSDFQYEFMVNDKVQFYFLLDTEPHDGESYYIFRKRGDENGVYLQSEQSEYPQIVLDGYGMAQYLTAEADQDGELGRYTIEEYDAKVVVVITFYNEQLGELAIEITYAADEEYGSYTVFEENLVIVDHVVTQYLGNSSVIVIPEGVTEIAADVFKDKSLTSVTFPASLIRIGDHAFENGTGSGGANTLKAVYFLGATPPELGEDVFRWIKGSNFKIFVPDGSEQAYRTAPTWAAATPSQPNGYAAFVTSNAEQANKPLFEVVDGVLVSYNNTDENPSSVTVDIPDDVISIADGVFATLDYIVAVNLNNVVSVGARAFYGCEALARVTGNNLETIGAEAFYQCVSLTELSFDRLTSIGDNAFIRCFGLVSFTAGADLASVGAMAFSLCAVTPNADESSFEQHQLIIVLRGSTPPELGQTPFYGSQVRIYVNSYETGVGFAQNSTWQPYLRYLRVSTNAEQQTWYSVENFAITLVLGDNASFGEGALGGLYRWQNDSTLQVFWFEYNSYTGNYSDSEQTLVVNSNGWLSGLQYDDSSYSFVEYGTQLTYSYVSSATQRLTVTAGTQEGEFNGNSVVVQIVNYRMQFTYDGNVYQLTLFNNNGNLTFNYTVSKVVEEHTYTAADGSSLTVREGNHIMANGYLKNVDGIAGPQGNGLQTDTWGWYLTKIGENTYTWVINWLSDRYTITAHVDGDSFTYEWTKSATYRYLVSSDGLRITALVSTDGKVQTLSISFPTSNGSLQIAAQITETHGNVLTVTVRAPSGETSDFDGVYVLTLNFDNNTFTYEQLS